MMRPVILASASPRRRELLKKCGITDFQVIPSRAEELEPAPENISSLALDNAVLKAQDVAEKHRESIVIGADTLIEFEGERIGKPKDLQDAVKTLLRFSGKQHIVRTGVCIRCIGNGTFVRFAVSSAVKFKHFDRATAEKYISLVPVLDKAGSYAIQEYSELIIEGFDGSFDNIVGLPVERLSEALRIVRNLN